MYCKNCGKHIDDDSKFCRYCGTNQYKSGARKNKPSIINIPKLEKPKKKKNLDKYDLTYKKDTDATIVGIIIIVINIIIFYSNVKIDESLMVLVGLAGLTLRIVITSWVVRIAKSQNRNTTGWGFFAFFMPSIALIVIGESRKIRSYPSFNYKNQNSLSTDNNEDNYDELSELRNNLKPDEIILMQKDDEFYIKMNKEEWEKAKAKGADEEFEEL